MSLDAQARPPGERVPADRRSLSAKAPRETDDVARATARLIEAVGKRVAREDPERLAELQRLDRALAKAWSTAIAGLRRTGYSDTDIGRQLGVKKQSVAERWPRS